MRLVACALVVAALIVAGRSADAAELTLLRTIALPDVRGRIDHLAVDPKGGRLFVAALGNNSVEVVDTRAGRRVARIGGLGHPQGIAYVAEGDRLFVASADPGRLDVFSGPSFSPTGRIPDLDDADNVRFDRDRQQVYVGYGDGALAVVDARTLRSTATIRLDAHPESFQLEAAGPRLFANVPNARKIAVVDRAERRVIAAWPVSEQANFPMVLDEADHRVFVVARRPAALVVFNTSTGERVATVPVCGDADDLFADRDDRRIYVVCGEGAIDVLRWTAPDRFERAARVRSAPGARTGLYVPEEKRLYVAAPSRSGSVAEVRVYATK